MTSQHRFPGRSVPEADASNRGQARRRIGVWTELPPGSRWANEGVSRVIGFLIEGAAERGDLRFEIVAPHGMQATIEEDLRSLAATENEDWLVHPTPEPVTGRVYLPENDIYLKVGSVASFVANLPSTVLSIALLPCAVMLFPYFLWTGTSRRGAGLQSGLRRPVAVLKEAALRPRDVLALIANYLSSRGRERTMRFGNELKAALLVRSSASSSADGPGLAGLVLTLPGAVLIPFLTVFALVTFLVVSVRGFLLGNIARHHWRARFNMVRSAVLQPKEWVLRIANHLEKWGFKEAVSFRSRLLTGLETSGCAAPSSCIDWDDSMNQMASYANENVCVEGWLVPFPFFTGSRWLARTKAVIFPDALGSDFPFYGDATYWAEDGADSLWRRRSRKTIESSDKVITFSEHVAARHLGPMFGVERDKVEVIPLASPDLAIYLPMLKHAGRTGSAATKRHAGDILRAHCLRAGQRYLADFPFETTPFLVVSTQNRITKNLGFALAAAERLVRDQGESIKLITTADISTAGGWNRIYGIEAERLANLDVVSLRDLPREAHAALLHCASMVVHPSFFEGIVGALPLYEALSVGTPFLLAEGPHADELAAKEPGLLPYLFDPYDLDTFAKLVSKVLRDREAVLALQMPIGDGLRMQTWGATALLYANTAAFCQQSARQELGPTTPTKNGETLVFS